MPRTLDRGVVARTLAPDYRGRHSGFLRSASRFREEAMARKFLRTPGCAHASRAGAAFRLVENTSSLAACGGVVECDHMSTAMCRAGVARAGAMSLEDRGRGPWTSSSIATETVPHRAPSDLTRSIDGVSRVSESMLDGVSITLDPGPWHLHASDPERDRSLGRDSWRPAKTPRVRSRSRWGFGSCGSFRVDPGTDGEVPGDARFDRENKLRSWGTDPCRTRSSIRSRLVLVGSARASNDLVASRRRGSRR